MTHSRLLRQRHALLARARNWWKDATLICITHDVADTAEFERVVVIEDGQVVENGAPAALREKQGGRYRALLDAEQHVREGLWQGSAWRKLQLDEGQLREREREVPPSSSRAEEPT